MGKKKKGGKNPPMTPGIKANNPNTSNVKNAAPSQINGMTVQNADPQFVQVPGTNIYVPKSGKYIPPTKVKQPVWLSNPWPGGNVNTYQQPMHQLPMQPMHQLPMQPMHQLPMQSQNKIKPKKKKQKQPTASNIQKPGTNVNKNQQPVQSQSKATPNNKTQPTANNVQRPGTNVNKNQQPVQLQSKVAPNKKTQPNANNIQRPATNVNTNQQPVQLQSKVAPNKNTQPNANNIQRPAANVNTNQQPVQSQGKATPNNKTQPNASNVQKPGTNIITKPLPVQPQYKANPKKKKRKKKPMQPTVSNVQRPGTNVNTKQLPVQSQSKVTPNNQIQPQQAAINIQRPGTNVNNKQQPAQSNYKATPDKNIQPTGRNIQQQASMTGHTPGLQTSLQSQASPATVTSTSGGTGNAASTVKVEEVDLTDDIIEIPYVKEVIEVDLTKDDIEVESTNDVIDVDSSNAARLLTAQPDVLSDASPDIWHKVIVKSAQVDRVAVLDAINKQISPEKLNPYFFQMENGHITFLVNNCTAALTTLFKKNLKVPFSSTTKIELKVQLRAKKVDLFAILQKVVSERLNPERSFLDLSHMSSIPEIEEVLYHPSVTSHLEHELMKTAQLMAPYLLSLSIAGNKMSELGHLGDFFTDKLKWRTLKKLDISYNKIDSFSELRFFKSLHITELNLHMNPLCGKYKEDAYIRVVKFNFPHILKLDGSYLQCLPSLPHWRPNFIFCSDHGNSAELADQFVEHFFTRYDGEERTSLWDLYHEKACFSISSMYFHGQSTSTNARLSAYIADCRNLLHPSFKLRSKTALSRGTEQILDRFDELPRTQHDPYSFTVDLLHHSEKSAILTVTGVFREQYTKLPTSPRHFMRTFVLVKLENDEYRIVNDIMYVTNASSLQATESFTYMPPQSAVDKEAEMAESDKTAMIVRFSKLTNVKVEWARKYLTTAKWNLRRALQKFVKLYEAHRIPVARFITPPDK